MLINYYNSAGELNQIHFEEAFNKWIISSGGTSSVINTLREMSIIELDTLPVYFLLHFQSEYDATLPEESDNNYQAFIYNSDLYLRRINRLIQEHHNRVFSLPNLTFILVSALILLGLISMCS